ncbi:hypothetical protein [Antarcticimicrobium sediminis]|uniref:Cytochrome P460 domain-containing protein n=1 Tax=Antarcticimicrobium sediminis TaxID=2546227 RepID=A0A4R5EKL7_9RHOB|nr:hypothetical protein [Antarcticimicrobium sediminis]TDE35054.1 hypothetical protein E1B25_17995 [Antarcticimicrobium sediminis]
MKRSLISAALVLSLGGTAGLAQDMPFGSKADRGYAAQIWAYLQESKLAGPDMIRTTPYEGTDPHGMMLETFYTTATINGHEGDLIVKRNFGPVGVTEDEVLRDPETHLAAYTIMFRREAGYDPEDGDWFWVKYLPDGSLDETPNGMAMAGQVAKGMDEGCIACHQGAGDDMVFTSDHLAN